MVGTKFSDYIGLNHYKKGKQLKHFKRLEFEVLVHIYHTISATVNLGYQLKKVYSSVVMHVKLAFLKLK